MTWEPWEQIPAKQLVTERMLERLNGLALQEPSTSGYVLNKSATNRSVEEELMAAENSFEFADSKLEESNVATAEMFTDTLEELQRTRLNASILEERLVLNEMKKATMALVPWSPPILTVDTKKYAPPTEKNDDCEASMEM